MITEKTVFIIGAGAGVPYKFPTGDELRIKIIQNFTKLFRRDVISTLDQFPDKRFNFSETFLDYFINDFKKSRRQIDFFINKNTKYYKDIGRLAIVLTLFDNERQCNFWQAEIAGEEDWYKIVWDSLINDLFGPNEYDISQNKISFITFNYDRSLEQYLYESLKYLHTEIPDEDIQKVFQSMKFYHVYGSLADLDWQNNRSGVPFQHPRALDYSSIIKNVKLIFEERKKSQLLATIHEEISEAKRIFFLGYGYLEQNNNILKLKELLTESHEVFGTAYNNSPNQIKKIKYKLSDNSTVRLRFIIEPSSCKKLLKDFL
ncbi:MAG: hypothetical protein IIB95_10445 [Candidatus Marinimicrobia bacterium]|nr:hypothetical protein [Candidatus Neomarinimicrobiota bacterium]